MDRTPIPSVATLQQQVHRGKLEGDRRAWYAWSRRLSIHLTWVLLHFPIRPNQVTAVSVAFAVTGAALLAATRPWIALIGALALLAHHFLDKVDGDIARYRGTYSLRGVYLDDVGHALAAGGLFLGLGLHLARGSGSAGLALLAAAAIGGMAMVIGNQSKNAGFLLYARAVLAQPELLPGKRPASALAALSREATHEDRGPAAPTARATWLARLRDAVLIAADYTLMLPLAATGLLVQALGGGRTFLTVLLVAECALQVAVLAALIAINYAFNVENEVLRLERITRSRNDATRP